MKKVRLAMMAAAMFLGVSTVARAQDPQQQSRGNRPNMAAVLFKDITLTPVQQAKADSISSTKRRICCVAPPPRRWQLTTWERFRLSWGFSTSGPT